MFEPNNETLWESIRQTVSELSAGPVEVSGADGMRSAEAIFVRCDRATMTQNDLDNDLLICLIEVAPTNPAECVIFGSARSGRAESPVVLSAVPADDPEMPNGDEAGPSRLSAGRRASLKKERPASSCRVEGLALNRNGGHRPVWRNSA